MERKIFQKPNRFIVGQIAFCNGGCTMQLPSFYRVVRRSPKTIWLVELESQLIEHDGYGQVGHKIPVDIEKAKGKVFYRRVQNWKSISDEFQEFVYQRNWGIIEPWDGLAKYYNCLD